MAKFYSLFSSSKGNAAFLGSAKGGVLVDVGVSCRRLVRAMQTHDIPPKAVQAIWITHAHTDHIAGLRVFLSKYPVPLYGTAETLRQIQAHMALPAAVSLHPVELGVPVETAEMRVMAFPTMHDAPGSCGYRFTMADGQTCAVCTDLGCVTPEVEAAVSGADLVLLEANYDPEMLRTGPYPLALQQRIRGTYGHLANAASADFAKQLVAHGTTRLILGHLSEKNNTPFLADMAVSQHLEEEQMVRNRDYLMQVSTPEGLQQAVIF